MSMALVLGNGESRSGVPSRIYEHKKTYGCNWIYKEFAPTHLICCDKHLVISAVTEGADRRSQLWTRSRWFGKVSLPGAEKLPDETPWPQTDWHDQHMNIGSGVFAAMLAAQEHDVLVFIGFDLWDKSEKVNNLYAGKRFYADPDSAPVDPTGWIVQFERLFNHYPDKQFVFLNWPEWTPPESWLAYDNFNQDELRQVNNL